METYKNLGGGSGVVAYEIGPDYIRVQFADGTVYRYTNSSAGADNIARMQELAIAGAGLNSFINANVRKRYEQREM